MDDKHPEEWEAHLLLTILHYFWNFPNFDIAELHEFMLSSTIVVKKQNCSSKYRNYRTNLLNSAYLRRLLRHEK